MREKVALFLIILIIFSFSGASQEWEWPDTTIEYSDSVSLKPELQCKPSDECPTGDPSLNICGEHIKTEPRTDLDGIDDIHYDLYHNQVLSGYKLAIPGHTTCSIGEYEFKIEASSSGKTYRGGSLTVEPKGMSDPHTGGYIFVELDTNKDKIRDFLLTESGVEWSNTVHNNAGDPPRGSVLLAETDWQAGPDTYDDYAWYKAELGTKINGTKPSSGDMAIPYEDHSTNQNNGMGDGSKVWDILNYGFTRSIKNKIGDAKGGCDAYENDLDTCSPIHDGGYYPEGELILAAADQGILDPTWHICRRGNDGQEVYVYDNRDAPTNLERIYKCDTKGNNEPTRKQDNADSWRDGTENDWELITACSDGKDNDGDGRADVDGTSDYSGEVSGEFDILGKTFSVWSADHLGDKIAAGCKSREDMTEGCQEGVKADVNHDGVDETCMAFPRDHPKTTLWSYPSTVNRAYYKNKGHPWNADPDDGGDYAKWDSKEAKVTENELGHKAEVPDTENVLMVDKSGEETSSLSGFVAPWDLRKEAGVYKCNQLDVTPKYKNVDSLDDEDYSEFEGQPCRTEPDAQGKTVNYWAAFNGTNYGYYAEYGEGIKEEGPHIISLYENKALYDGISSNDEICDGPNPGPDYISGIKCNDKPPHGWSAVTYPQDPSEPGEPAGEVEYEDLRERFTYEGKIDVENWTSSHDSLDENLDGIPKEVAFTGGFVGNCISGRSWIFSPDQGWRCGGAPGETVKVNFTSVRETNDKKNGYTAALRLEAVQMNKLEKSFGLSDDEFDDRIYFQAQCWIGGENTMPANVADMTSFGKNLKAGETTWMNFTLPARSDAVMDTKNEWDSRGILETVDMTDYSCTWAFKDNIVGSGFSTGTVVGIDSIPGEKIVVRQSHTEENDIKRPGEGGPFPGRLDKVTDFWQDYGTKNPLTGNSGYGEKCKGSEVPPVCYVI